MTPIAFEWSLNEKVATESAIGVSVSGARSMVVLKHSGLNVALEAITNAARDTVGAGLVVLAGDEAHRPSAVWRDSRALGEAADIPVLDASGADQVHQLLEVAYAISEGGCVPVLLRCTEDLHYRFRYTPHPRRAGPIRPLSNLPLLKKREKRLVMHSDWEYILSYAANSPLTTVRHAATCGLGVVRVGAAGASEALYSQACCLHLQVVHPLPPQLSEFISSHENIIVIEEVNFLTF